jgi:N-carbamoylputrescine amidase
LHRKQYFPNEPGWFESEWYSGDGSGFKVADVLGLKVGVLFCTEAMFNERARAYGKQGASLIVIPRASGVNEGLDLPHGRAISKNIITVAPRFHLLDAWLFCSFSHA